MNYGTEKDKAKQFLADIKGRKASLEEELAQIERAEQQVVGRLHLLDELLGANSVSDDETSMQQSPNE